MTDLLILSRIGYSANRNDWNIRKTRIAADNRFIRNSIQNRLFFRFYPKLSFLCAIYFHGKKRIYRAVTTVTFEASDAIDKVIAGFGSFFNYPLAAIKQNPPIIRI